MTMERYSTTALQIAAAAVMRAYLDYRAGRGVDPLRRYLTHEAAATLDQREAPGDDARRAPHAALGPYAVLRLDQQRAYVCAGVLDVPGHDSVLVAELVATGHGLRAARVGRAAEAARNREPASPAGLVGDGQAPAEPPPHLRKVLGGIPDTQRARELWVLGAAVVDTYRDRHDLHGATLAFGDPPQDAEQQAERDRAVAYLRELTREIDRLEPDRATQRRATGREPELGR